MLAQKQKSKKIITASLIVCAVVAIIGVAMFTLTSARTIAPKDSFYQYFNERMFEYSSEAKIVIGENSVVIIDGETKSATDTSPIYYSNSERLVVPRVMSWVDPYSGKESQFPLFSAVSLTQENRTEYKIGAKVGKLEGGFLFDGNGTYIFLDDMIVKIDGTTHNVSKLSFAIMSTSGNIRLYNYKEKTYIWEEISTTEVYAATLSGAYAVHLMNNTMTMTNGQEKLLFIQPDLLEPIA